VTDKEFFAQKAKVVGEDLFYHDSRYQGEEIVTLGILFWGCLGVEAKG